jgi:hypothetical protein
VSTRARSPFSTAATSIPCASICSGFISIKPSGAFSALPLVPEDATGLFAVLNSTDEGSTFAGGAKECTVRTGGTCDNMPPSATPITRLATIVGIRFIYEILSYELQSEL